MTVHSLFDFVLHVMGLGVTFSAIAGVMFAAAALRRRRNETDWDSFGFGRVFRVIPLERKNLRIVLTVLALGFAWLMFLSINNYLSLYHQERGRIFASQKLPTHELASLEPENTPRQKAIRAYEKALFFDPRNYVAALWLGTMYWEMTGGNWEFATLETEQALQWHERAIRANPYFGDAHMNRANLYLLMGRIEEAQADCQRLLEIAPLNPVYRFTCAKVCLAIPDYACAREHLEKALETSTQFDHDILGAVQFYLELIEGLPRTDDYE